MIKWYDVETLGTEAAQLANLSLTIEAAMSSGHPTADTYLGSMSILTTLMHEHANKLNSLMQEELKELRSPNQTEAQQ